MPSTSVPSTSAVTVSEMEVVESFLAALEAFDTERAVALLDPEVVYQNVPFPPARGRDAVTRQLEGMTRFCESFEVVNHNIAAAGPVVLTERTDIITMGGVRAAFWVCGTFEVHDGRITLWRDRFDFVNMGTAVAKGAVRAALRAWSAR
jgi:limonene-1,2-epoxide hydrolase